MQQSVRQEQDIHIDKYKIGEECGSKRLRLSCTVSTCYAEGAPEQGEKSECPKCFFSKHTTKNKNTTLAHHGIEVQLDHVEQHIVGHHEAQKAGTSAQHKVLLLHGDPELARLDD